MERLVSASSEHASPSPHSKCSALATIGREARDGRLVVRGIARWGMPPACIDIKALVIEASQSTLALSLQHRAHLCPLKRRCGSRTFTEAFAGQHKAMLCV